MVAEGIAASQAGADLADGLPMPGVHTMTEVAG
jgi:hypothetical protein